VSEDVRRRALRAALERRLHKVREQLRGEQGSGSAAEPTPPTDAEELLRYVMVRLLPAVGRAPPEDRGRADLVAHVRGLLIPARGTDLRFLDAWNNAYERLADGVDPAFLGEYADLLNWHVRRLASP
jgi:hypothetical protein